MATKLFYLQVWKYRSLLFSLTWEINKSEAHECGRGHLKLVSARKHIGQAGATEHCRPAATALDTPPHVADAESHPFTHYQTLDTPIVIFFTIINIHS